jgi:spectinomycin phosphotransferase
MLEPPNLPDETIIAALRERYGLAVTEIAFLPIGNDASAWVYRVNATDGDVYFLKVRKGSLNEPGLLVPRTLHEQGVAHIIPPLPTAAGAVWTALGNFTLILYPFIEGEAAVYAGMEEQHWIAYGAVLRQTHAAVLPPNLTRKMRVETFTPGWIDVVRALGEQMGRRVFADPIEEELAAFWLARRAEIETLVERAEALGQRLRASAPPLVLCHADIHTWNLLIDTGGKLWVVDWDETVLAPKERDLMFVVGGIGRDLVHPHEEAWFFEGYGPVDVDALALAYYRYARAVEDIGSFAEEVFSMEDVGVETKRAAMEFFMLQFEPGNIVSLAHAADIGL